MLHVASVFLILTVIADASPMKNSSYNHYRLPNVLKPERYKLRILTHLEDPQHLIFTGDVQIQFEVLHRIQNITLHVHKLVIDDAKIKIEGLNHEHEVEVESTQFNREYNHFIIWLSESLKQEERYILTLMFAGELNRDLRGYYMSSYVDTRTNETRYLSVTQFEPANARSAFPCFDEPQLKATFVIWLGHHMKYRALSNMPLKETIPINERQGWQWSIFEETVPMSTYLVAYTINDFASVASVPKYSSLYTHHTRFRTWARADAITQCAYAAEIGPKILAYYESLFGIKFPIPKLDQIAIPDFSAGAMENWGLVTYREATLLYSDEVSSLSDKQRVASVIAHELAHQWFGNLVTMKWWTDLWLNEGFATYVSSLGVQYLNPSWSIYDEESLENTLTIMNLDAFMCSHPISQKIAYPAQISEIFDSISYKKGSVVIRMMSLFMGKNAFGAGITEYLKQNAYKNAEQNNLWRELTIAAHQARVIPDELDLKIVMETWTLQTGYPIVIVMRDYEKRTAEVRQMRYLQNANLMGSGVLSTNSCWFVPLSYTTERAADFTATMPKHWLQCNKFNEPAPLSVAYNLPDGNEWILFNVQMSALYRVNYDKRNWDLIIKTLRSGDYKRIHVMNRAQLIDDALNLAWSGHADYEIAFQLLEYLTHEYEYMPWRAALENLGNIDRILHQSAHYEYFRRYIRYLLLPTYKRISYLAEHVDVSLKEQEKVPFLLLVMSWACRFDVGDCKERSLDYFRQWQEAKNPDAENPIPKNIRSVMLATAIRYGTDDDWHFLWERYKKSNVASEKKIILVALGCTRETWLLHRYLSWAYDANAHIRKHDSVLVFISVARGDVGYHVAQEFFMSNIDFLYDYYNSSPVELSRLLYGIAMQMSTPHAYGQLKTFVEQRDNLFKMADMGVRRAMETAKLQLQWRRRSFFDYTQRLKERGF